MALTPHIALLRAVNVGGRKAIMSELRRLLADLGYDDPRTLLQSGNLVFGASETGAPLEDHLEREIARHLGFASDVMLRSSAEWRAIVAANPHVAMAEDDPAHLAMVALKSAPTAEAVAALKADVKGREVIEAVGRELYIVYPDGMGESKLTATFIERRLGVRGTARNWNTVLKLAAML